MRLNGGIYNNLIPIEPNREEGLTEYYCSWSCLLSGVKCAETHPIAVAGVDVIAEEKRWRSRSESMTGGCHAAVVNTQSSLHSLISLEFPFGSRRVRYQQGGRKILRAAALPFDKRDISKASGECELKLLRLFIGPAYPHSFSHDQVREPVRDPFRDISTISAVLQSVRCMG